MMYYSTGQLAKSLNVSQDHIRRLCECGAIKAELTPGKQFRIPQSEWDHVHKHGLPPPPRPLPGNVVRVYEARPGTPPPGLYAEPSRELVDSAEQVAMMRNEVKTLKLQHYRELAQDRLEEKKNRQQREADERERQERARQAELDAAREREDFLRRWERYAVDRVPFYADPPARLEVQTAFREKFVELDPLPSGDTMRQLIESIVNSALRGTEARKESERAVETVMNGLPYDIRYSSAHAAERDEALRLMTEAVKELPVEAGPELREATARRAAAPVLLKYNHAKACQEILEGISDLLPGSNREERELARRTVTLALEKLPVEASRAGLEAERDRALGPSQESVRQRVESEKRAQREKDNRRMAEFRMTLYLSDGVSEFLNELARRGKIRFADYQDRRNTAEHLEKRVRPLLVAELTRKPVVTIEPVQKRIQELCDEHLDAVVDELQR